MLSGKFFSDIGKGIADGFKAIADTLKGIATCIKGDCKAEEKMICPLQGGDEHCGSSGGKI